MRNILKDIKNGNGLLTKARREFSQLPFRKSSMLWKQQSTKNSSLTFRSSGPASPAAELRRLGLMSDTRDNPFAEHYVPAEGSRPSRAMGQAQPESIEVRHCIDLEGDLAGLKCEGFQVLGTSEFVERGNRMGISHYARLHASSVGASLVLFQFLPAKLRAVRYLSNGTIDISSVREDPPASLSPRGYFVARSAFLASPATLCPVRNEA